MPITSRWWCCLALLCALGTVAWSQDPETIVANQNRAAAGSLQNGVLTLRLEIRRGTWHPEAEDGPKLYVEAFGEEGKPALIPGPMMRMPEGTTVHVTVANKLKKTKATVYGLNTRPGDAKMGIEIPPGESRELTFAAGAAGTYYYWARTSDRYPKAQPLLEDAQLNGAFIVDPPGIPQPDRILVIDAMGIPPEVLSNGAEILTINGKSYPFTEPLEYTQGETIRWRVINPSFSEHPMHLHGSFYQVLSLGDFEKDTTYAEKDREWVVTQNLMPTQTMMMEWEPPHAGRWLFHCHFHAHIANDARVPMLLDSAETTPPKHDGHDMTTMHDMAGLVMAIDVKPTGEVAKAGADPAAHKIDLVIEPNQASGKLPAFSCAVRDGKKLVAAADKSMGPPIIVTRGEPVEITVLNHLKEPTTIHWHGIELESYYDGVMGGGIGTQMTPAIAPGESFVARFTPNRAGTFIYHTHAPDPLQLTDGVYGALIVLDPGETFDPERDRLLVVGTRDSGFFSERLTLNGTEEPGPILMKRGVSYRLRVINIAPELPADLQLGSTEHPASWHGLAKDGAELPARLAIDEQATLHIASGETYDFEFKPESTGEIPLQIENKFNSKGKLSAKIVVQ